jgi:pimeloyl-ACP methyl ester carboxylesterase
VRPPADAWTDWGGDGGPLLFSHANGFPPAVYRALLTALTGSFRVASFSHRPLWSDDDPTSLAGWHAMADDLRLASAETGRAPIVGVGHSLGGVLSALAAAAAPELFSRLILLDPVVFTGTRSLIWGWMKRLGLNRRFHLARLAERRRDRWPDRSSHRAAWSGKPVFRSWDPGVFEDYLNAGVVDASDGSVRLRYPRAWEARIFAICPHHLWPDLRRVRVPTLIVRGETSDTLTAAAAGRMMREMPDARCVEIEGTSHFLPMEKPDEVAKLILDFAVNRESDVGEGEM